MTEHAVRCGLGVLGLCLMLSGCSSEAPLAPSSPGPRPSNTPPPFPPTTLPDRLVSGTVWIYSQSGVETARGGSLYGWVEVPSLGKAVGPLQIDPTGHYAFNVPGNTTMVRMQPGPGVTTGSSSHPCAAVALQVEGNISLDLHIVADSAQLGPNTPPPLLAQQPTLSGVVYEETPDGRVPIPNAWVSLDILWGNGDVTASTLTDAQGRYVLCAIPPLSSMVLFVWANGYGLFQDYSGLAGVSTLDIELRR